MNDLLSLLRELCNAFGPPGFEGEVRDLIRRRVEPLVDDLSQTPLGNLIATRRGLDDSKTLLLDAHTDEVGLMVTYVEPNGFLRFAPLGGIDPRVVPAQRAWVRAADGSKHLGVVGVLPPHVTAKSDYKTAFEIDDLTIDLGCRDAAAVEALGIRAGAPAVLAGGFAELADGCVTAKALDDRAGCAVLIKVLEALREEPPPVNVVATFTVQEETGGLGAQTATHVVAPEVALALEGTTATDAPGVAPHKVVASLRKGPAVTIADARTIVPEKMVRYIEAQAREAGIPLQYKIPRVGGTNGHLIQQGQAGVLTGILSVPCRAIHSSVSVLAIEDLDATLALATRFVSNAAQLWD